MACEVFVTVPDFLEYQNQVENVIEELNNTIRNLEDIILDLTERYDQHENLLVCDNAHGGIPLGNLNLYENQGYLNFELDICNIPLRDSIELTGIPQLRGEKGEKGDTGERGIPGESGKDGIDGRDGEDGRDGFPGFSGIDGRDGRDGVNGLDGRDGKDGENGVNGLDGEQGERGEQGQRGREGRDGRDGENGVDGIDGKEGRDGINGIDGINGRDGRDGIDGINGTNGIDGRDGRDGTNGRDGINGENGVNGTDGENGRDGRDGEDADEISRIILSYTGERLDVELLTVSGNSIRSNEIEITMNEDDINFIINAIQEIQDSLTFPTVFTDVLECQEDSSTENGLTTASSGVVLASFDLETSVRSILEVLNAIHTEICSTAIGKFNAPPLLPVLDCGDELDENGEPTGNTIPVEVTGEDNEVIGGILDNYDQDRTITYKEFVEQYLTASIQLKNIQQQIDLGILCNLELGGNDGTALMIENRVALEKSSELLLLFVEESDIFNPSPRRLQPVHIPNPISVDELCDFDEYFAPIEKVIGRYYCYVRYSNTSSITAAYFNIEVINNELNAPEATDYFDNLARLTLEKETDRKFTFKQNVPPRIREGQKWLVWRAKRWDNVDGEKQNLVTIRRPNSQ